MDCRKRSHQRRRRAERANVRQVPRKAAGDFAKDRRPRTAKRKILSKSDIAGIVVGSVAAGGLVAFIGATLIKKRRKK